MKGSVKSLLGLLAISLITPSFSAHGNVFTPEAVGYEIVIDKASANALRAQSQPRNLVWYPCLLGSFWDEQKQECVGNAVALTWSDAQEYIDKFVNAKKVGGYSDWRLPTIYELSLQRSCKTKDVEKSGVGDDRAVYKDVGWLEQQTGESILTENGREYLTKIVTMKIPDNLGGYVDVPKRCTPGYSRIGGRASDLWALNRDGEGVWYVEKTIYEGDLLKQTMNPNLRLRARIVRSDVKPVLSKEQHEPLPSLEEQ
ncbi:hypothetical protein B0181_10085 [Moraxella caviae]|uniref:Protein of uncharacterized function (DUF1566) n=1 Tax=Moraxella caviae TaxID=34060 RepID=A0A1S9ZVY1_9GAMM|nr:DUF1566 domain-containing protein [Moraxella caviae]OOR87600.1 hypothetical protein B0181_10085 [Moraxella caviae]STZ13988.1 Protein of uncharacterised function (DUF1566) [Moraxella caviae]VEW13255.1 Protein of uncharacterised function (DUF1566) [Moraxella caviae]